MNLDDQHVTVNGVVSVSPILLDHTTPDSRPYFDIVYDRGGIVRFPHATLHATSRMTPEQVATCRRQFLEALGWWK